MLILMIPWTLNGYLMNIVKWNNISSAYHFIFLWEINETATKMFKHIQLNS